MIASPNWLFFFWSLKVTFFVETDLPGSQPEPQPFGGSSQKLVYFSGFDVSLVALQKVLGIPRDSRVGVVSPASAMIFELHQDNSTQNYTVQVNVSRF